MRFSILALDYDGTIAQEGVLDAAVRQAIAEARAHGVTVVIVTGRSLDDLRQVMGDLGLVDAVVAENGAVLASTASERLLTELRRRGIESRAGAGVIETAAQTHVGKTRVITHTVALHDWVACQGQCSIWI